MIIGILLEFQHNLNPLKGIDCGEAFLMNHKTFLVLLCTITVVSIAMSSTALAEVTDISISPENPSPGDTVTVTGKASPNEEISATVSFNNMQTVSDGTFKYNIGKVTIPDGSDSFSLRAEGVDDLGISIKLLGIPISVPANYIQINNNVATFGTGKIKSGTYDITLSGSAPGEQVALSFGAKASITADSEGNFEYVYSTDNMPEGDFNLNVGGQNLQMSLGTTDNNDDSGDSVDTSGDSSSSSGRKSSKTGTDLKIVELDKDESDGVGEDTEASTIGDVSESTGEPDNYREGYELTNQSSGIKDKLPDLGIIGVVLGVFSLGAIIIGYRKNKYK